MKLRSTSFLGVLTENFIVGKRHEPVALSLVKFILELNPMETECVQEAFHDVHRHKYCEGK